MKTAGNIDEDNMKKYFQEISTMMILKKYFQVAELLEGKRIAANNRFSENVQINIDKNFDI